MFKGQLLGNISSDPVMRTVAGDKTCCVFSIAGTNGFGDKKVTTFVRATAWGKTGDAVYKYCKKGDKLYVYGDLKLDEYDGKDGKHHAYVDMHVEHIEFCTKKQDGSAPQTQNKPAPQPKPSEALDLDDNSDSDELPF